MKKVIVILIIFSLIFISFFAFKKEEEKINKNISVILETEEGNIETNTFPSKKDGEVEWFISPYPERNIGAFGVSASGSVSSGSVTNDFNAVRPVLYLKSSAKIISGEGTLKNMYKLK